MYDNLANPGGITHDRGFSGQVASLSPAIIISRINTGLTAFDFGIAVTKGAVNDSCKAITADTDPILGLTVKHITSAYDSTGQTMHAVGATVPIMKFGYLYITALENVTEGDAVISITAQSGRLGSTTGGAPGAGRVAVVGAKWCDTVAAGQMGLVEINRMGV